MGLYFALASRLAVSWRLVGGTLALRPMNDFFHHVVRREMKVMLARACRFVLAVPADLLLVAKTCKDICTDTEELTYPCTDSYGRQALMFLTRTFTLNRQRRSRP